MTHVNNPDVSALEGRHITLSSLCWGGFHSCYIFSLLFVRTERCFQLQGWTFLAGVWKLMTTSREILLQKILNKAGYFLQFLEPECTLPSLLNPPLLFTQRRVTEFQALLSYHLKVHFNVNAFIYVYFSETDSTL